MNKKLTILLTLFIISVFSIAGCKKDANKDATKDTKKVTKEVKKDGKKEVKKEDVKAASGKLDLSYFPDKAVVVGSFDIQKFLSIKELQPLLTEGLTQAKAMGIDLEKVGFASYYMNLDSLEKADDVAILVSNLVIPEATLTQMGLKVKKETYEGMELLLEPSGEGGFTVVGKDLLAGSTKSIKKMIDVKKGKSKNLAGTETAKELEKIFSKSKGAAFKIAFVPNDLAKGEITKLTKEGEGAMAAEFLNNLKSASFSIAVSKDSFDFAINIHSNKAGVDSIVAIAKPQLSMLTQDNSPMLGMVEPMLGKEGTEILTKVIKTLKVTNDGDYLSVTFSTKFEYWLKAPKIFGDAMKKMMR
jgi:hypothetical protein